MVRLSTFYVNRIWAKRIAHLYKVSIRSLSYRSKVDIIGVFLNTVFLLL